VPPAQVECKIDSEPTNEQERVNKYEHISQKTNHAHRPPFRITKETKDIARQQHKGEIERQDIARQQNKAAIVRESEQAGPSAGNDEAKHDWAGNKPNHQLGSTFPAKSMHVKPCMLSGVKQASTRCPGYTAHISPENRHVCCLLWGIFFLTEKTAKISMARTEFGQERGGCVSRR